MIAPSTCAVYMLASVRADADNLLTCMHLYSPSINSFYLSREFHVHSRRSCTLRCKSSPDPHPTWHVSGSLGDRSLYHCIYTYRATHDMHGRSTEAKVLNNEVDSIVKLQWRLYHTLPAQKADLTVLAWTQYYAWWVNVRGRKHDCIIDYVLAISIYRSLIEAESM